MLDAAPAAAAAGAGDLAEMPVSELRFWAAATRQRRREEDQKWDARMLGLCTAVMKFAGFGAGGKVVFDPARYFPSLFEGEDGKRGGGIRITDRAEKQAILTAWAAKAAGKT